MLRDSMKTQVIDSVCEREAVIQSVCERDAPRPHEGPGLPRSLSHSLSLTHSLTLTLNLSLSLSLTLSLFRMGTSKTLNDHKP